jgi:hypothetical protein
VKRTIKIDAAVLSSLLGVASEMASHMRAAADGDRPLPSLRETAAGLVKWWEHESKKVPPELRYCRVCFCTEERACVGLVADVLQGACWWAERPTAKKPGLCSVCAPAAEPDRTRRRK